MRLPYAWLREFVAIDAPMADIADHLVRLGHEVEGVETPRADFAKVRIGKILTMEGHPNADRLHLLTVDIGEEAPLSIVCGARNMGVGDKVAVATVGATLPGGMVIKKGKIRGEASVGMCCSEKELGLADDADGLLILPEDAPIGQSMGDYLQLEEAIFDLSITPNRGDCMSVYGLARELAADRGLDLAPLPQAVVTPTAAVAAPVVERSADGACPCYVARRIIGVRVADAPAWLQARLRAAGLRPVNGVVDVLNYLMLETGQPMHAFDAAKISGSVAVRQASAGETIAALDVHDYPLAEEDLVIADGNGVLALAGIIGSEASGVTAETTELLLESAYFQPAGISRSRRRLGIVSEASMRFERGVDPLLVQAVMERATAMILDLFGGEASAQVVSGSVDRVARRAPITIPLAAIRARLGVEIDAAQDAVLRRMGFAIERGAEQLKVTAPAFRHDVTIAEDLSEEYARIIGYDAIPFAMPQQEASALPARDHAMRQAVNGGFVQVVNYAFISAEEQRLFVADDGADVVLANPISSAMAVMRRSLLPGLMASAQYNLNRQQAGVALVEQGRGYVRSDDGDYQETALMGWLLAGEIAQAEWYAPARMAQFRDIKGAVEQWLLRRGVSARFVADDAIEGLQPGQSARLLVGKSAVGVIGRVRLAVAARFQVDTPLFVAEIATDLLPSRGKEVRFAPLPEFPAITRDVVLLFSAKVTAAEVVQAATRAGGKLLEQCRIFDRFAGEGVADGHVSLGIRCVLRDAKRTLTQEDADRVMASVVAALQKRFGAVQR